MFKFYSSYALLFSSLTHTLCCGIPIIVGFASLYGNIFIFELLQNNFDFLESFELYLFTFSTFVFLAFFSFELYNRKIKFLLDKNCCEVNECEITKRKIRINILLSGVLYIFNTSLFLLES